MSGREDPAFMDDAAATRVVQAMTSEALHAYLPRPHTALGLVTSHDATPQQRRLDRHSAQL